MAWTKHFRPVNSVLPQQIARNQSGSASAISKFSSWLPEFYQGPPNRLMRYMQYEQMDLDHEVAAALDTIADFSTHIDETTHTPFSIHYHQDASSSEKEILMRAVRQWSSLNEFPRRMFRIFRSTLMYGDQFLIRDPETFRLHWVDPSTVEKVLVNESEGKDIEAYYIRELDLNLQMLTATNTMRKTQSGYSATDTIFPNAPYTGQANYATGSATPLISTHGQAYTSGEAFPVDAQHVVQLSLTEGMNNSWPFGISILENIFKVYKQKELLEDSILIYRVHRAPERRVFFIDIGTMPPNKAAQYLERIRYEVQQKRIPSRTGGGESISDAAYNPMCVSLSTRIPLLDGRTLSLSELIEEYKTGKENWAYSCNPETGKIVPGNITWAGITKRNAEVIEIMLDNDQKLVCTPDHKIPVLGKGFVEAQNLTSDDSLISFETREKSLSKDKNRSYTQVYDHETNKWIHVHRMVAEFMKSKDSHNEYIYENLGKGFDTVHHDDYNRYNNSPNNLIWMNSVDHIKYHSDKKSDYWENLSEDEASRVKDKIRISLQKYRIENPEDFYQRYITRDTTWIQKMKEDDPERFASWRKKHGEGRKKYLQENPIEKQKFAKKGAEILSKQRACNQTFDFTRPMLTRLVEIVKQNDSNRLETISLVNKDSKFIQLMKESNLVDPKSAGNIKNDIFTDSKLKRMYAAYGYKGWKDFKKKTDVYNHRIKSITRLPKQDVGTITIDFQERWHDYHTFAIEAGIFVKNSMLEDYFFATTADGRGSKVETLPGGENLGQIDDLRYFNNKMLRGLGVPSSYLPTGPDDGSATYNDGRIGTAFIQEFRFSRVCQRHQKQMMPTLDEEFKLFLKHRGFTIDSSIFELQLSEPQNFSEYRQIEVDAAYVNVFNSVKDTPWLSKRYAMKRYLGLTEDDIAENERMWREEQSQATVAGDTGAAADLRSVGVGGGGDFEFGDEDFGEEDMESPEGEDIPGGEDPLDVIADDEPEL